MKAVALVACAVLLAGCFGYNAHAKKWSYVGDSVLIVGGGATIADGAVTKSNACTGMGCPTFKPPFSGILVTGVIVATVGLVGLLLNATRPTAKPKP